MKPDFCHGFKPGGDTSVSLYSEYFLLKHEVKIAMTASLPYYT